MSCEHAPEAGGKGIIEMHAGNRLHDASVAHPQAVPIDGLHAADVRAAELRERNARIALESAGHAGRPQQFVVQMAIHELMDIAQILQQLPGLAERRSDQLDQRLGKIRGDVLVGERSAESGRDAGSARSSPAGETRSDSFSTPLRPPRSTPRSPELMSPARRRSNCPVDHVTQYLDPLIGLGQLGNDLDFHEESRIHQTLHLYP